MRLTLFALLTLLSAAATAEPTTGPVITAYGPTFPIRDPRPALPSGFEYKAVFDLVKSPEDLTKRNPYLESAARFINMHVRSGVPLARIKLAVVIHGQATNNTLSNAAYQRRFGHDNPNLALIEQLSQLGVKFYLCGQSAGFRGVERSELADQIEVSLSAMTAQVLLQSQGYALLP